MHNGPLSPTDPRGPPRTPADPRGPTRTLSPADPSSFNLLRGSHFINRAQMQAINCACLMSVPPSGTISARRSVQCSTALCSAVTIKVCNTVQYCVAQQSAMRCGAMEDGARGADPALAAAGATCPASAVLPDRPPS